MVLKASTRGSHKQKGPVPKGTGPFAFCAPPGWVGLGEELSSSPAVPKGTQGHFPVSAKRQPGDHTPGWTRTKWEGSVGNGSFPRAVFKGARGGISPRERSDGSMSTRASLSFMLAYPREPGLCHRQGNTLNYPLPGPPGPSSDPKGSPWTATAPCSSP